MRFLGMSAVCRETGLSRRTIYYEIKQGRFPKPVQLTAKRVGWLQADVRRWMRERIQAHKNREAA